MTHFLSGPQSPSWKPAQITSEPLPPAKGEDGVHEGVCCKPQDLQRKVPNRCSYQTFPGVMARTVVPLGAESLQLIVCFLDLELNAVEEQKELTPSCKRTFPLPTAELCPLGASWACMCASRGVCVCVRVQKNKSNTRKKQSAIFRI